MLQLSFKPESEAFIPATDEYADIWQKEGASILEAFEVVTGLVFMQTDITVVIFEGVSFSGNRVKPMRLRASYDTDYKKAALVHELGHRLIAPLHNRIEGMDEHMTLNLFLYDVWVYLYGEDFADNMVAIESKRKGIYDYEGAWKYALGISKEERVDLLAKFKGLNIETIANWSYVTI